MNRSPGPRRRVGGALALAGCLLAALLPGHGRPVQATSTTTMFDFTGKVQTYAVPPGVHTVTITAVGAQGGNANQVQGGKGASMQGTFTLLSDVTTLSVLVGGQKSATNAPTGGGGGSFVWTSADAASSDNLLLAAGGGGGAYVAVGQDAVVDPNGTNGADGSGRSKGGLGGTAGQGGTGGGSDGASLSGGGGGGGLLGDGGRGASGDVDSPGVGGHAISKGGAGGGSSGGFGGGGGAAGSAAGGGGGYSGGGGGGTNASGGGGGSFNGGANQTNTAHVGVGNGSVTITASIPADTTPPVLTVPGPQTVEATGSDGAVVAFTVSASDPDDTAGPVSCLPSSGSTFPLGNTTVNCSATDTNNNTGTGSFSVTVQDTTPPSIMGTPGNQVLEATGPTGAVATYTTPTATDLVDGSVSVVCVPTSGGTFGINATTSKTTPVTCSATDTHGNTATTSFNVTVQDTTPPTLTLPASQTVNATGPSGAVVNFTATATDLVDGSDPVSCTPAAGATFAIGSTTVHCSATDQHGNPASGSFTVTVKGAVAQLSDLQAAVQGVGPGTSLANKVQDALAAVQHGRTAGACATLQGFLNEVRAQTGKKLSVGEAQALTADAQQIRAVLGC